MTRFTQAVCHTILVLFVAASFSSGKNLNAAEEEFSRKTIDLGLVVSDVERSVKFYTQAIGFKEVQGFSVPGDFAADTGLTDGKSLTIRVLTLGEGSTATKLKIMEVPGARAKKSDNKHIHSQLGFSYITINVIDTNKALARLKKQKAKLVGKSPVELPKSLAAGVFLTIVRDPDGNLVELVGPKK